MIVEITGPEIQGHYQDSGFHALHEQREPNIGYPEPETYRSWSKNAYSILDINFTLAIILSIQENYS